MNSTIIFSFVIKSFFLTIKFGNLYVCMYKGTWKYPMISVELFKTNTMSWVTISLLLISFDMGFTR
jgi:hypothetical protein